MQHILVPTDFSDYARNAFDYALQLAKKLNSSLTVYHACQVPASGIHRPPPSIIEQEKQTIIHEARRKLRSICGQAENEGAECSYEVAVSPVCEGITEMAKLKNATVIVMGTMGASGIAKWLFGSCTASVMQTSEIPVLAIPQKALYREIERIVFATDYRDSDFGFIGKLVKLASDLGSELALLHVQTEEGEFRSEALFKSFREKVTTAFDYGRLSFHLLEKGDVIQAINNFSISYKADIISMATSRKSLFERIFSKSMTMEMAYATEIPLLAFHS